MPQLNCVDRKTAELRTVWLEFFDGGNAAELIQGDGKVHRLHLIIKTGAQFHCVPGCSQDSDPVVRRIGWLEERQTLDVIPMSMRDQERGCDRASAMR
jgi:hypothetical protein